MKKPAYILLIFILAITLLTAAAAADDPIDPADPIEPAEDPVAPQIIFGGLKDTGDWVYAAEGKLTIPVILSGYENGLSSFQLILDIKGASVEDGKRPTYETTNGKYIENTESDEDPYYELTTWCFAYAERSSTTSASAGTESLTRFILTHSGVSIYGDKPFGNEPFRIGTLTIPIEPGDALRYITIDADMNEAYDNTATPVPNERTVKIGIRPYPEKITYYGDYYNTDTVLDPVTALVENEYYGKITACVYTGKDSEFNLAKNLYDAVLGDTIAWTLVQAGSAKDTATLSKEPSESVLTNNVNPTPISGKNTGSAYLNAVITFTEPTIGTKPAEETEETRGKAYVEYTADDAKYHAAWTDEDIYKHKFQTGFNLEFLYLLEIPTDFNMKSNVAVTKTVRVSDFTIPEGKELNVYLSSDQFDSEDNIYQLYYIKDESIRINYSISIVGETPTPITTNHAPILTADEDDMMIKDGLSVNLDFKITGTPEMMGKYRDKLTFYVDFRDRPVSLMAGPLAAAGPLASPGSADPADTSESPDTEEPEESADTSESPDITEPSPS